MTPCDSILRQKVKNANKNIKTRDDHYLCVYDNILKIYTLMFMAFLLVLDRAAIRPDFPKLFLVLKVSVRSF